MFSNSAGTSKRARALALVLPILAGMLVAPVVSAQTSIKKQDAAKLKRKGPTFSKQPRPQVGGWINAPSGWKYKKVRSRATVEFKNETVPLTASRIVEGKPKLETSKIGTEVVNNVSSQLVALMLSPRDGKSRCRINLPSVFQGGLLQMSLDNVPMMPMSVPTDQFFVDVPGIIALAQLSGLKEVEMMFYGLHNRTVETLRIVLSIDLKKKLVQVLF